VTLAERALPMYCDATVPPEMPYTLAASLDEGQLELQLAEPVAMYRPLVQWRSEHAE